VPDPKRDVERLIEDGLIRYGGGDLAGALVAWERALIQDPGNVQAIGYVDYVRHVFEQLNRPTRDELVVPFGLGNGDAPDYQIEISPEPPDDDAMQSSGALPGLQDGWLISHDDERDTLERLYSLADPPGTLDLDYEDEPAQARHVDTEDTTDFGDATPVIGVDPERLRDTREDRVPGGDAGASLSGAGARGLRGIDPAAGERGGQRALERANARAPKRASAPAEERASTPAAERASAPAPVVGERGGEPASAPAAESPLSGAKASATRAGGRSGEPVRARVVEREDDDAFEGPELEVTPGFLEAAAATPGFGDEPEVTPGFSDAGAGTDLKRPDLGFVQPRARRIGGPKRGAEAKEPAAPSSAPTASAARSAKAEPILSPAAAAAVVAPAKKQTAPPAIKAAPAGPAKSPTTPPAITPAAAAAAPSAATPSSRAVTAKAVASPRTPPAAASAGAPGLLDPWAALAEGNAGPRRDGGEDDGGDAYANFEMAPLIEELPPSSEPPEPEPTGPRVRAETATRDLGLAGRYRPREDSKFGEEAPTRELMRHATEDEETTQAWAGGPPPAPKPSVDPLEALAAQILPRLDRDAVPSENRDDRLRRRITALVELAGEWSRLGEVQRAVAAVDLALAEDPDSALAQKLVHRNRDAIMGIFQGYLGSLERRPNLARGLDALGASPIGARAAFLLSRVDGHLTFDEILDVSGMPRLEAYRYLCQLLIRGILTVE
jgi:hypothetical protein